MTLLGIDLGTSSAKAMLCAPDGPVPGGPVLGRGAAGYDISTPRDGWAQTDPEAWWRAVQAAVREATVRAGAVRAGGRAEVSAIAVTGQMHGVVLLSEQSVVLRPAILWLDRRATAEMADYLRLPPESTAVLGNAPAPGMAGPLLAWLARHEPDTYHAARWQFQPKDWLRFRLTGEPATDPTDASGTLLYDLHRDSWATDVVRGLGLRSDLLPPVRPSGSPGGALLPSAAAELGLPPGLPVAIGASDTAASLLAAGLPGPEWALLTLGSGGQWIMPCDWVARADPAGRTNLFRAVDDGQSAAGGGLFRIGSAQNVGVTLNWVRGVLGASWDDLYGSAAGSSPGSLVFHPELVSERPGGSGNGGAGNGGAGNGGGWSGATLATTREDLMRAALTGLARLLRHHLDDLRAVGCGPEKVMLGGGGGRHQAWRDLLAAELGLPLYPAATPWLTVRGATMLAGRIARND